MEQGQIGGDPGDKPERGGPPRLFYYAQLFSDYFTQIFSYLSFED